MFKEATLPKYVYVCSTCNSENVKCDAWAVWNVATQSWETAETFDSAWCDDCDGETNIEAIETVGELVR